jgi:N-acetylglutamate synthase-like GNAT family acetyltransferase
MENIFLLNSANIEQYEKLTYPVYRHHLKNINKDKSIITISLGLSDQPIGLILAKYSQVRKTAEILSLFVIPEYRQTGIATQLLLLIEQELVKRKCQQMNLIYIANETTPALEKILTKYNWSSPIPRMLICSGMVENIKDAPWLNCGTKLASDYEIFPWRELSENEKEMIQKSQQSNPWYPDILSPFKEEKILEKSNSLGLRYKKQIVGWMITHRIAEDTIRYTSLFVRKELQSIGRSIPLLTRAIKLQIEMSEAPQASFTVILDNEQMIKFVERRIKPYLTSFRRSFITTKFL